MLRPAFRLYVEEWEATGGNVSFETCEMLFMLQDDTAPLADRIESFNKAHGSG